MMYSLKNIIEIYLYLVSVLYPLLLVLHFDNSFKYLFFYHEIFWKIYLHIGMLYIEVLVIEIYIFFW